MFPLMGNDDRENMTRIWQQVMPADAFAGATQLVERAIGDDYAELARRIPNWQVRAEPGSAGGPRRRRAIVVGRRRPSNP